MATLNRSSTCLPLFLIAAWQEGTRPSTLEPYVYKTGEWASLELGISLWKTYVTDRRIGVQEGSNRYGGTELLKDCFLADDGC